MINILERWKRHFNDISSEFNPIKILSRQHVEFVYDTLNITWGNEFFIVDYSNLMHNNKAHFLHNALTIISESSFYYLFEICLLINHAKNQSNHFIDKLDTIKLLPDKTRELLFEMYVEYIFHKNGIKYETNVFIGNQCKDGFCEINGVKYLVECKKKYSVVSQEIRIRQFLMTSIYELIKSCNYAFELIGVINIKINNNNNQSYHSSINYIKGKLIYHLSKGELFIYEDDEMRFELKEYNDANRIELENKLIPYTLYFTLVNKNKTIDNETFFRLDVHSNIVAPRKKVVDKLIDSIRKARKQHAENKKEKRIFILDNEYLNDIVTPLLNGEKVFEEDLKQFILSKETDDIILIIYRYFGNEKPEIKVSVICKENLNAVKQIFENLDYYSFRLQDLR